MRTTTRFAIALSTLGALTLQARTGAQEESTAEMRIREIGVEAYVYAYPMVLMEITRRVSTNVAAPDGMRAPMNQFAHVRTFPDHTFRDVVRPNVDTLYSTLWFDVSEEPLIITIPEGVERYFMLPMLDMWTEAFASPGTRTVGSSGAHYAIVPPGWSKELPDGVEPIQSPTSTGWIIGRTQENGTEDLEVVHRIQDGFEATPLGRWGQPRRPQEKVLVEPSWDTKAPPPAQVEAMKAEHFFALFSQLLKENPPHEVDWSMVALLREVGIVPGEDFEFDALTPEVKRALDTAVGEGLRRIRAKAAVSGVRANGWQIGLEGMGTYGTSYLQRANIALIGLGANVPADAIYPIAVADAEGEPFDGSQAYVMHFERDQIPPVDGFWSLTVYGADMYLADNPIGRYSLGDRDQLTFNPDGSLDLLIQHQPPKGKREANWLPVPAGTFDLVLRLYWPRAEILTGAWVPPEIKPVRAL